MGDLKNRALRVGIVGSGYVGLTSAACLSSLGHRVTAVDLDREKVLQLRNGEIPIFEPGLDELVADGLGQRRLRFTVDYKQLADSEIVLLCLPTPQGPDGVPDISCIETAARDLAAVLAPSAVLLTKSTVPVGAHHRVREWLGRDDVVVASNPEFLREGSAIADFMEPDRIVIGANDPRAIGIIERLYAPLEAEIQVTDVTSAELVKYASNSFLATKLSFINEMARLCEATGADVDAVARGMGSDRRIGNDFMRSGPGWGGSCFPKDTRGLTSVASAVALELTITSAAIQSNEEQLDYTYGRIMSLLEQPPCASTIGGWGLTFKANTDDVRESPAVHLTKRLVASGANVMTYDPAAAKEATPGTWAEDPYAATQDADLVVVLTEWDEFADIDFGRLALTVKRPVIFDARSIVDAAAAASHGFTVHRIGRPTVFPLAEDSAGYFDLTRGLMLGAEIASTEVTAGDAVP